MAATNAEWRVAVGAEETSVLYEPASTGPANAVFVCAHGAGGHMRDRGMERLAAVLRAPGELGQRGGIDLVRFNFLYREQGSGRPDAMPRLKACAQAVIARAKDELQPRTLIIGGRSMGGRVASMLAAEGLAADGLLLLAYPLHPAGKPEKLRDAHLSGIQAPVLCFNGTRDALCRRDLMERALAAVRTSWDMQWLEGADHSFHVLKSSGRTDDAVLDEIGHKSQDWIARLVRG